MKDVKITMRKLSYLAFRKLIRDEGYSEQEIIKLYKSIKQMDKEVLFYFINWANGAPYPNLTIENIDIPFLVSEYGLHPINAFIVLSWLKEDPLVAKYILLSSPQSESISENEKERLRSFLRSKSVLNEENNLIIDTTDIEVDE